MSLLKLLVASLALVVGVALALPGGEVSAQQPAPTCEDPNPEHIVTLGPDSAESGIPMPAGEGRTFYARLDPWFTQIQNHLGRSVPYPLPEALAPGFYMVRAEWLDPVPVEQMQLEFGTLGGARNNVHGQRADYLGSPVVLWVAFELRDRQVTTAFIYTAGASRWSVDLWRLDCSPWTIQGRHVW